MSAYAANSPKLLTMTNSEKPIRGIIFDYGGTLDTRGDHWSHIIEQGWRRAGLDIATPTFRHCYVHAERELARVRHILPCDDFHALMLKKIRLELQELERLELIVHKDIEQAAVTAAAYCNDYARACIDEVKPALADLAGRFPLVLVSNFYGNVDEVVRTFGIRQYFRGIIESAVVGVRKPDARIFRLGTVALGLEPDEVLVVGDSLRKDILPARSIGCATAWIKGKGWTPDEDAATDDALIPSVTALPRLLASV